MLDYGPSTYGECIADIYDTWYAVPRDTEDTVSLLFDLAAGRAALELGIGTGRIALPLAQRGLKVAGIDASEAMVARLREKPGGEAIPVVIGDFADVNAPGQFGLVFVVFNTFFALTSQEDQVRCFANVARRLQPDGLFVIEAFVPDVTRYRDGQSLATQVIENNTVVLDAAIHNPMTQELTAQHVVIGESSTQLYPVKIRYAWPTELDLMARLAKLRLRDRWGGWRMEPFTPDSRKHVSVYERD